MKKDSQSLNKGCECNPKKDANEACNSCGDFLYECTCTNAEGNITKVINDLEKDVQNVTKKIIKGKETNI